MPYCSYPQQAEASRGRGTPAVAGRARAALGRQKPLCPDCQGKGGRFSPSGFRLQNGSLLQLRCDTKRAKPTQLIGKVEVPQYLMQNSAGNTHFLFPLEKNAVARRLLPLPTACLNGTCLSGRADALERKGFFFPSGFWQNQKTTFQNDFSMSFLPNAAITSNPMTMRRQSRC